jgi:3-oxoacyl-[acyl-carrier-protein] synthase-3
VALFGDAATATWLSASGGAPFGRADCGTDGAGAERLIVRAGGSAAPVQGLAAPAGNGVVEVEGEGFRLSMHGRSIFNFMMEKVPLTIEACLAKNGLADADVDLYVFHQASKYMLDRLSERLGLEPERVPRGMARVGNTVSSSIPLLLADLGDRGELAGRTVLAAGFGVGLSWASNVVYFGKGSR